MTDDKAFARFQQDLVDFTAAVKDRIARLRKPPQAYASIPLQG
jgi:hypothetical protein